MNLEFGLVLAFCCVSTAFAVVLRNLSLDTIHFLTLKMLNNSLRIGWNHFCTTDVDQEVMRLFPECSPSSVAVILRTYRNETVTLSTQELSKLSEFGLEHRSRTLVFVCGMNDPQTLDVRLHLLNLQERLTDFNVLIVDFATSVLQLFSIVKLNVHVSGLLVAKVLGELKNAGVSMSSVTLIGHSAGANIAALGARMFTSDSNRRRLPLLIAVDPALMCSNREFFVDPSVCKKVVVVHAENSVFSEREDIGSVDIYLNGDDGVHQPGCSTSLCSHLYPLVVFIQTVMEERDVVAVKCRDWGAFRKGKCNFNDTISLGLHYDKRSKGKYYSVAERFASGERESVENGQVELLNGSAELLPIPAELITQFNKDPVIFK